jgi:uncharacterized protein (DUF1778 family)
MEEIGGIYMKEKTSYLGIRISPEEKDDIQKAAYREGKKVSKYLLDLHRQAQGKCPCCGQDIPK